MLVLPEKLPDSLQKISCYNNKITKLPEKLPDSLQEIDCDNNQITKLRPLGVGPIIKGHVGPTRKVAGFTTNN